MTALFKAITCVAVAALACSVAPAQVISTLEGENRGVVTSMKEGTVKEDDYAAKGIFNDWSDVLKDFSTYQDEKKMDEIRELKRPTGTVQVQLKGKELQLPSYVDENGIDLYLLTTEGIKIYMALSGPTYFQEPDADVIKWVRYYAHRNRSQTRRIFKRYEKWEPLIKEYFRSVGVPPELSELCLIESGCTYEAESPAGALGMWQIMPATARHFGLEVSLYQDERKDPVLSTQAAAKILLANYRKLGEWTLAAAAYNCGAGRIQSEFNHGRQEWNTIKSSLPKETSQYIPGLLAIHYVWTYRDKLNLK